MHRLSILLHSGEKKKKKKTRKTPTATRHQHNKSEGCPGPWRRWSSSRAATSGGPDHHQGEEEQEEEQVVAVVTEEEEEEEERGRTRQRGGSDRSPGGRLWRQPGLLRGLMCWLPWCGPSCHTNGKQRSSSPEQEPRRDSEPPPGNWLRNGSGSAERTHTNTTTATTTTAATTTTTPAHRRVPRRMGKMQCLKDASRISRTPEGVYVNGELVVHPSTSRGGPSRNGLFRTYERPLTPGSCRAN